MIYSPSLTNSYGGDVFPILADAIFDYMRTDDKNETTINRIKKGLSIVTYTMNSAISILKEPFDFSRSV